MKMENKKYWNDLNRRYADGWKSLASRNMSERELNFINHYLAKFLSVRILDIGIGAGRILDNLVKNSAPDAKIYGVDIAENMVSFCRTKFQRNHKIIALKTCDVSKEKIATGGKFDFITAIRVLKYSKNWQEILKKLYFSLNDNGVLIFTMPNSNSINRFAESNVPAYRTTVTELKSVLNNIGFEIMEIRSFTKLPDLFYISLFANNRFYVKLLISAEKTLELLLGKKFLGRMLFVAVKK